MRIMKIAPIAAALALVACSGEAEPEEAEGPGEQGGSVKGEVLGGSISDAMLPLDELRSQSPPLRAARSDSSGEEASEDDPGSEEPAAPAAPAAPTPAPTAPPLQVAPPVDDASEG